MIHAKMKLLAIMAALTTTITAHGAELDRGDRDFLASAAYSGLVEIRASELALQKSEAEALRAYAQMVIEEHGKMHEDLQALADRVSFTMPPGLDEAGKRLMDDLNQLSGLEFDAEYADQVAVDAHEDAIEAFEIASQRANDNHVEAFAIQYLPMLKKHLAEGETLKEIVEGIRAGEPGALGGNTPAARTEPPQPDRRY